MQIDKEAVLKIGDAKQIPRQILNGLIIHESGWNLNATRFEPDFYKRYPLKPTDFVPKGCSRDTEWALRSVSWGIMQIMGETARENGFRGWFPELVDPVTCATIGVNYLSHLQSELKGLGWNIILTAYNRGLGMAHVDNGYAAAVFAAGGWTN